MRSLIPACARRVSATAGLLFCLAATASAQVGSYEAPPRLDAGVLLGTSRVTGEHFAFDREVTNDGLMNHHVVVSDFQRIEAYGNSLALERAREQEAIAALREIKKTEAFRDGVEKAVEAPLVVSHQLLHDPARVMEDVPRALSNLWHDAANTLASVGKGSQQELDAMAMLKDLAGFTRTKRRLAAQLGVDPFSSNGVLQSDLDQVSWVVFAGGASIELAMSQAPLSVSLSFSALREVHRARSSLWDIPIVTLLQASVAALKKMGLTRDAAESLVYHPNCTVTHQTLLVSALADVEGVSGRDTFARLATNAADESACRLHMETAELLWTYHHHARPLEALEVSGASVRARDVDAREILVLRADYVAWTDHVAELADALPQAKQRSLWLSGAASPRSRSELERRGFRLEERVFDRYPPEIEVAAILTPERANPVGEDDAENQTRKLLNDARDRAHQMIDAAWRKYMGRNAPDREATP